MKCHQARIRISAYLDHELDAASARQLKSHLRQCAMCREVLTDFEALDNTVRELTETVPSPGFAAQTVRMARETEAIRASEAQGRLSLFERLSRIAMDFVDMVTSTRSPSTGTLDEFNDFPPLSMGHIYFKLLDLPASG